MPEISASDPIGRPPDRRKLIAVVYADVVAYSRLIGLDDAGTLRRLRTLRRALIDPTIREHGGTVVQTGGDSLMVVFDSIDGAVRCAVRVQQQVPVYDGDQLPDRRIRFRVGINTGDAIPDGTDLHGDAVNIAARLEAECPVGGICVTRAVRDQVHGRLDLAFEPIGSLTLKNIARPVEAFVLHLDPAAEKSATDAATGGRRALSRAALFAGFAGLLIVGAGGAGLWLYRGVGTVAPVAQVSPTSPPATTQAYTPPPIGLSKAPRLSIAVLPFANLSGDQRDDYLAEGITEDVTTDLSRVPGMFVIARESAYAYQGKAIDVRKVGEELGVRYVLEGSVRKLGDGIRVNAQLIATETGAHLWADRFDQKLSDLSAGQEEIVARIGQTLNVALIDIESARSKRERPSNPDAFDLILRARSLYNQPFNLERLAEIRTLYERAVQLDPTSVDAKAHLSNALIEESNDTGNEDLLTRAASLLAEAASLDANSSGVITDRSFLLRAQERWPEAMVAAQRLIDLDPNNEDGYNDLANLKMITGAAEEAIFLFKKAIRIDPRNAYLYNRYRRIGYCLLVLGREQESIEWLQRALAANPEAPGVDRASNYRYLASAYALTGHSDDAHRALTEAEHLWPHATVRSASPDDPSSEAAAALIRHYQEGLRLAGLRDHADEDADFGVSSDGKLHRDLTGYSPNTVPGVVTIRTAGLVPLLAQSRPIVIDTLLNHWGRSIPGAVGLKRSGRGGNFTDVLQNRLRRKVQALTRGDLAAPIVAVGWNSERFDGHNLALRLVALGYTNVYWYRGGREAWEVGGLPETEVDVQDW